MRLLSGMSRENPYVFEKRLQSNRILLFKSVGGFPIMYAKWLTLLCLCHLGWQDTIPVYFCVQTDDGLLTPPLRLCHHPLLGGF